MNLAIKDSALMGGKSDPYFELWDVTRPEDRFLVARSNIVMNCLNPVWTPLQTEVVPGRKYRILVWDYDRMGRFVCVCVCVYIYIHTHICIYAHACAHALSPSPPLPPSLSRPPSRPLTPSLPLPPSLPSLCLFGPPLSLLLTLQSNHGNAKGGT